MLRLRTALSAALLALGASSVAEAQQPQGAPQGAGARRPMAMVERMLDSIALTPEQTTAIDAIKKKYEPEVLALRQQMMDARQNGGDMAAFRTKNQELNAKIEGELRAALTKEQVVVLEKNKAAMAQMRGQGGGGRPPRA